MAEIDERQISLFDEQFNNHQDYTAENEAGARTDAEDEPEVRTDLEDVNELPNDVIEQAKELSASDDTRVVTIGQVEDVDPRKIEFNPENPFDNDAGSAENKALEASIAEEGIMVCLIARRIDGMLILLSGERRLRAALALGLLTVPVRIVECDDSEAARIMLDSNMCRKTVTEAELVKQIYIEEKAFKGGKDELKDFLGKKYQKDIRTIERYLELANGLSDAVIHQVGKTLSLASAKVVLDRRNSGTLDEKRFLESVKDLNRTLTKKEVDKLINNDYDMASLDAEKDKKRMHVVKFNSDEVAVVYGNDKVKSKALKEHILNAFKKAREQS